MSRRRRTRRQVSGESERLLLGSDEELEEVQTSTQERGISQGEGGFASLSEGQQDELVHRFIRYMLFRNARKRPVRRTDLTKAVFRGMHNLKSKQKVFAGVYQKVQTTFRSTYGMEVMEITRKIRRVNTQRSTTQAASSSQGGAGITKAYILVTTLPPYVRVVDAKRLGEVGFLTVIASMILLTPGCRLEEESLYRNLERIGVQVKESGGHKQLNNGNVKELLEKELPEQWYLEREKEDNSFYYTLGSRLRAEMSDENLLDFVEAVYQLGHDGSTALDETAREELKQRLVEARGQAEGDDEE